jgi:hypothetical protein
MRLAAAALLAGLSVAGSAAVAARAQDNQRATELQTYHKHARKVVGEVLSGSEFAESKSSDSLAKVWEGVKGAFCKLRNLAGSLPRWLAIVVLIWALATLVAILVHLAYVIGGAVRKRDSQRPAAVSATPCELHGVEDLDAERAQVEARRRIAAGDWTGAVRYLYVTAILLLDRAGLVRVRPGKTNYDYVRELAQQTKYRAPFELLTRSFETSIYGRRPADRALCDEMTEQMGAFTDVQHT